MSFKKNLYRVFFVNLKRSTLLFIFQGLKLWKESCARSPMYPKMGKIFEQNCTKIIEKYCGGLTVLFRRMKEFPLNGGKVLLVKQEGQLFAVGTKCSHYGAPLVNGTLTKGRVRCPWHGACFRLKTGKLEWPTLLNLIAADMKNILF